MKKKILMIVGLLSIISLTGCGNKSINLDKAYSNLENDYKGYTKVQDSVLEGSYGIDLTAFNDYLVVMDEDGTSSKMYAIFEKKENSDADDEVTYFISQYNEAWDNGYFPEETALVKNGEKTTYGNYVIYVVSSNNEDVVSTIKKSN